MVIPTSPRLKFKLLLKEDFLILEQLIHDPHVREFLMEGQDLTAEECVAFIENGVLLRDRIGLGPYLIYCENKPVGYCGFMETHPPTDDIDVVYAFKKEHTGNGFATEVCSALIRCFRSS